MRMIKDEGFTRRGFMKAGGALVVMAGVPLELVENAAQAIAAGAFYATPNPAALATWLTMNANATVIARSGHVELGHGVQTGLAQILAEGLDVPVTSVSMVLGNTDVTPDQGGTFGSQSIKVAGTQLRQIAAEGRAALLELASTRLGSPVSQLTVKKGVVSNGSQTVSYGQLVQGKVLTWVAPITFKGGQNGVLGTAKPKDTSQYSIVGQSVPRMDIPDKVTAKATYVSDVKVPGMLHARVIHPKGIGSTVVSVGGFSPNVPGAQAVTVGNLIGVVAEREWDAGGNLVAWWHEAWMPPNNDSTELGASLAGKPIKSTGIGGWTGPDLYTFANSFELNHGLPELGAADTPYGFGLRTSFLRSPGQYQITFAQEAFVDEIAAKAGKDPLEFRLKHLTDPRAIAVLQAAAKAAGWDTRPSPKSGASTRNGTVAGRGVAFALRDGTYAAAVLNASVDPGTGKVQVQNVWLAQDSGLIINPMAIEHQIESAVLQTVSRALFEEVTFDTANVTSLDWKTYPILTMADAPKVTSVLINHPEISPTGTGEPACNVLASAISSAIFDATGVRIRTLPLRPDRVKAALGA